MSLTKLFPVSFISYISAGDGKIAYFFYSVGTRQPSISNLTWQAIFLTAFQQRMSEIAGASKENTDMYNVLHFKKRNYCCEIVPLKFLGRKASLQYMGNG